MDALFQVLACIVTLPRGPALVEISKCSSSNVTWDHWYDGEDTGSILEPVDGMNGHLEDGTDSFVWRFAQKDQTFRLSFKGEQHAEGVEVENH